MADKKGICWKCGRPLSEVYPGVNGTPGFYVCNTPGCSENYVENCVREAIEANMPEPIKNYVEFDDGKTMVYVQACTAEWANIGVFVNRGEASKVRSGYYHVCIPDLKRNEYELPKPGQLSHAEFDAIIESHRDQVLLLLEYLRGLP